MIFLAFFLSFSSFLFASWPEETLAKLTLDQKIGQLFLAPACPLRKEDHWADWDKILKEYHIGGALVKQSDPISQVLFLNRLQAESEIPLFVVADAEWGLAMRMTHTLAFPRNMTLGAIDDMEWIYRLGKEIGRQAKRVGVHMNLAPVADVNNNPANPVIHMRSFGDDPVRVAACVSAYAQGLQSAGVLACAKHFPGHGDTSVDSHYDLPVISHLLHRLESVELVPFQRLIQEGFSALMTAHLYIPALDPTYPTSLSTSCLQLARDRLHFHGLILSDALNMKAVADRYTPEKCVLLAHQAGCDWLLYGDHREPEVNAILREQIPRAFKALKEAYLSGAFDMKHLDTIVLRILRAKEKISRSTSSENLLASLNSPEAIALKKRLFEEAVTLVGEPVFPIPENTAYLSFGDNDVLAPAFTSCDDSSEQVVIAVHQKEALAPEVLNKIHSLSDRAILCLFTTPYALKSFKNFKTILLGYENDPDAQQAVLQVLKGETQATGHLPVALESCFNF